LALVFLAAALGPEKGTHALKMLKCWFCKDLRPLQELAFCLIEKQHSISVLRLLHTCFVMLSPINNSTNNQLRLYDLKNNSAINMCCGVMTK
jgi:hypothetical protein